MPRLRLPLFAVLALLVPAVAQAPVAKGPLDLRIPVAKGASVWLSQQVVSTQELDVAGMAMESAQRFTRIVRVQVEDVDAKGELRVCVVFARVHGAIELPMGAGAAEYDSAQSTAANDEAATGMARRMAASALAGVGKTFTARVDRCGQVLELTGVKEIVAAAGEGGMFGEGVSEDQLRELVAAAFGSRPPAAVAVGAKWPATSAHGGGITGAAWTTECTLTAATKDAFEVAIAGGLAAASKAEPAAPTADADEAEAEDLAKSMNRTRKVLDGKLAGTLRIGRADGFVLSSTTTLSHASEFDSLGGFTQMQTKTVQTIERTTEAAVKAPRKATAPADGAAKDGKPAAPKAGEKNVGDGAGKPGGR